MMQSDLQPIARKQVTAINRTSVELKLLKASLCSFNTSIYQSYQCGIETSVKNWAFPVVQTINRTSVELKPGTTECR